MKGGSTSYEPALAEFASLVRWWGTRTDLVAPGDLVELEQRHIADSLKALPVIESAPPGPAVDVGSGAGFPGVPLAICEPTRRWRLLEPRRLRSAFLEEVVRSLDLSCEVVATSAEEAARDPVLAAAHAVATARALAPPGRAFELMSPLLAPDGVGIVWAGARARLPQQAEVLPEGLAIIRKMAATPRNLEGDTR